MKKQFKGEITDLTGKQIKEILTTIDQDYQENQVPNERVQSLYSNMVKNYFDLHLKGVFYKFCKQKSLAAYPEIISKITDVILSHYTGPDSSAAYAYAFAHDSAYTLIKNSSALKKSPESILILVRDMHQYESADCVHIPIAKKTKLLLASPEAAELLARDSQTGKYIAKNNGVLKALPHLAPLIVASNDFYSNDHVEKLAMQTELLEKYPEVAMSVAEKMGFVSGDKVLNEEFLLRHPPLVDVLAGSLMEAFSRRADSGFDDDKYYASRLLTLASSKVLGCSEQAFQNLSGFKIFNLYASCKARFAQEKFNTRLHSALVENDKTMKWRGHEDGTFFSNRQSKSLQKVQPS